ncbi:thermonuclease family protein [Hyphococcus formosus]|uniref:thermonuclease family protein n=1 Tax=Hyphococcus formosus TaxID=3143534 RepID=UPI00398B8B7D
MKLYIDSSTLGLQFQRKWQMDLAKGCHYSIRINRKHRELPMIVFSVFVPFIFLTACGESLSATPKQNIYWSDGDSGRIGSVKFRLANVDAPETGGVGARGGAKCETERKLGFDAKAYMVKISRNKAVSISTSYGEDRYGRLVADLEVDGKDVAMLGLEAGHLRLWPHDNGRALAPKPDWCVKQ